MEPAHDCPMQQIVLSSPLPRDALADFLDAHVGRPWRDDIGPLIGQASLIRNFGVPDADTMRYWNTAVNAAVSSEAARDRTAS